MKNIKEIVNNIRFLFDKKNQPNFDKNFYNEEYVKEYVDSINKKLKYSGGVIIQDESKKNILILNPKVVYDPEKSTNEKISLSLVGNLANKVEIDFPRKFLN